MRNKVQFHPWVEQDTAATLRQWHEDTGQPVGHLVDQMVGEFRRQGWTFARSARPAIEIIKGGDASAGSLDTAVQEEP